eukprot:TRINITY_DN6918_c0_g1_i1.p2 TRINITY_DN6918_c0_g1~~TRINITY_DN6918_c0_g1_i1.p2  ORF type:complete len:99 (+),score=29.70 TRINITY_DN6918_c0_g1_i1:425-721(+)
MSQLKFGEISDDDFQERYSILEQLGFGGHTNVFRAVENSGGKREVALKMTKHFPANASEFAKKELEMLSSIASDGDENGIIQVLDAFYLSKESAQNCL